MKESKTLYLIRHAKSSWDDPDISDSQRTLNKRGLNDAPLMGKLLKEKKVNPDLIISSPATRALATAEIFASELHYKEDKIKTDERIYDATMRDLMNVIREIDNECIIVMLFGHNPGLTNFANVLGNKFISEMPTCSVIGIKLDIKNWSETERHCGKIFLFEYPKKHFTKKDKE
jgi:phosphohistidine phosphatase